MSSAPQNHEEECPARYCLGIKLGWMCPEFAPSVADALDIWGISDSAYGVSLGRAQKGLGLRPLTPRIYYRERDGSFWTLTPVGEDRWGTGPCEFRQILVKRGGSYAPVKNALRRP